MSVVVHADKKRRKVSKPNPPSADKEEPTLVSVSTSTNQPGQQTPPAKTKQAEPSQPAKPKQTEQPAKPKQAEQPQPPKTEPQIKVESRNTPQGPERRLQFKAGPQLKNLRENISKNYEDFSKRVVALQSQPHPTIDDSAPNVKRTSQSEYRAKLQKISKEAVKNSINERKKQDAIVEEGGMIHPDGTVVNF